MNTGLGKIPNRPCLASWEDVHCYTTGVLASRWEEVCSAHRAAVPCTEHTGSTASPGTVCPTVLHMMFPLTCAALEALRSFNYSCCSSPCQSHLQPTRIHCCSAWSGLPQGSLSKPWVQKCICSTEHNQHFTLHLFAATISFACCLKYSHRHKSCSKLLPHGHNITLPVFLHRFLRKSIKATSKRQDY